MNMYQSRMNELKSTNNNENSNKEIVIKEMVIKEYERHYHQQMRNRNIDIYAGGKKLLLTEQTTLKELFTKHFVDISAESNNDKYFNILLSYIERQMICLDWDGFIINDRIAKFNEWSQLYGESTKELFQRQMFSCRFSRWFYDMY